MSECNGDRAGIYCICIVKHSAWCQCNGAKATLILPAVILITKQLLTDLTRDDADKILIYVLDLPMNDQKSRALPNEFLLLMNVENIQLCTLLIQSFCIFPKFSTGSLYSDCPRRQCDLFSMEGRMASPP